MSDSLKIWFIVAAALVVSGALIFVLVMSFLKWDFFALESGRYEENIYEVEEDFDSIEINVDTEDIIILPSEDGKFKAVCYELKKAKHSFKVDGGCLTVGIDDRREWYDHIFNFAKDKITLYLPKAEYSRLKVDSSTGDVSVSENFKFGSADVNVSTGDVRFLASATGQVKITTTTGDIFLESINAASLSASVSTGNVIAKSVKCEGEIRVDVSTGDVFIEKTSCMGLVSSGTTGNIMLKETVATGKMTIDRSTGDISFDGADAAELDINTTTGNITGTLLSEKIFFAETTTGRRDVPKSTKGGRCEMNTSTGDIIIAYKTE